MTAELRRLDGAKVEPGDIGGDPEVVSELERLLTAAKEGRLVAFHIAARVDGHIGTISRGHWPGKYFEALGALAILQHDLITGSHVSGDPLDD